MDGQEEAGNDTDVDLFVFDANNNKTYLVSAKAGSQVATGNGGTGAAFISDDGQTVVFESDRHRPRPRLRRPQRRRAEPLPARPRHRHHDARRRRRARAPTDSADAGSQLQGLSANGQTVLFQTTATDVVANFVDSNADAPDLYVRRSGAPRRFLITGRNGSQSESSNGTSGLTNREATISANGARVFFASNGTDLNGEFTVDPRRGSGLDAQARQRRARRARRARHARLAGQPRRRTAARAVVDASADGAFVLVSSTGDRPHRAAQAPRELAHALPDRHRERSTPSRSAPAATTPPTASRSPAAARWRPTAT